MRIKEVKTILQSVLIEILNHNKNNFGIRQYKIISKLIKAIDEFPNFSIPEIYLSVCADDKDRKFRYIDFIKCRITDGFISAGIENIDYYYGSDTFESEYLRLINVKGKCKIDVLIDEEDGYDLNYWKNDILGLLLDDNVEIEIEEYWEDEDV